MLVDRYPPADLFALVPKLLADFEPVLRELDRLLDDDAIFQRLKADLARRTPHSLTLGRPGTPVEVVLRLLVVKRLYGWSYEAVEHFAGDSLVLRQFCRVYLEPVPDDTTLLRWANLIAPATLAALNERVVELARGLEVTRGRKLRLDSTVVETTIHYPSDSGLLYDGVRVLGRLLRRARAVLGEAAAAGLGKAAFRTRTRSVRRLAQRLHRLARRKGAAAAEPMRRAYARLIGVARKSRGQAAAVCAVLRSRSAPNARRLVQQFETFLSRAERAIAQAVRRVLKGAAVPAAEKIVSLFEPHTRIIVRPKAGQPVEFGRKLWLEEVEGGLISGWRVLAEAGQDVPYLVAASLAAHRRRFGRPPWLLAADRGVSSPQNVARAEQAGVRRVAMPATGKTGSPAARRRWFLRRGCRFRPGIEGRISVLRRGYGLDRCRDHGEDGPGRWVGWGVVTANLEKIARTVADRATGRAAPVA